MCFELEVPNHNFHVSLESLLDTVLATAAGAGKTTLLNIISGYGKPSRGSVTIYGQRMNDKLRRRVSYVMQNDVFFPNLTLRETLTVRSRRSACAAGFKSTLRKEMFL